MTSRLRLVTVIVCFQLRPVSGQKREAGEGGGWGVGRLGGERGEQIKLRGGGC